MKEAANRQEPFYLEYPVVGFHDQQQRWLRAMGGSNQSTGKTTHFSGVIMDITESKQNELRRNRFIGMVSHELKTPLTALNAYIQLLNKWAKQKKDNFTVGALSKLQKQVKKMTTMINGFLNFSGAESGKIHLNKSNFDINELLKEVIAEISDVSPERVIILKIPAEIMVCADHICGSTGTGKSFLASALGHHACSQGYKVVYYNLQKLLLKTKMSTIDGTIYKFFEKLSRTDLLILDDFGLTHLEQQQRMDFMEIIEDRHACKATIIASQLPVASWYDVIGENTIADALLDRMVHTSYRIELKGKSLRKKK
jgi:hypothetical protein